MAIVELQWTDNSSIETNFKVYRSESPSPDFPSNFSEIGEVGENSTSFEDVNAESGKTYTYAVVASNEGGISSPSISNSLTIPSELPPEQIVELNWTDNSNIENSYNIYRSTNDSPTFPSDYTKIDTVGKDITSYNDTDAPFGGVGSYAVTAKNSGGESAPTIDTVVLPLPITIDGEQVIEITIDGETATGITMADRLSF